MVFLIAGNILLLSLDFFGDFQLYFKLLGRRC